jgi:hypothetical protein
MLLLFGCNSEYKNLTVDNELCSYSLGYPSYYEIEIWNNFDIDIPSAYLFIKGPIEMQEADVFDPDTGEITTVSGRRGTSFITIHVANYKIYFGESYSAADKIESVLEDQAKWANFELLERTPLTVSGVQGEVIVYLVDRLMPIPVEDGKNLDYFRSVYFDYNGLTWVIEAQCTQEIMEQVIVDFEHIVETFTILE